MQSRKNIFSFNVSPRISCVTEIANNFQERHRFPIRPRAVWTDRKRHHIDTLCMRLHRESHLTRQQVEQQVEHVTSHCINHHHQTQYDITSWILKQECIPVGCVPPAAVGVRGVPGPGGLHQAPPPDQTSPPGAGTPPGPDPPGAGTPPLWTESHTPVETLPSRNFVCGR